MTIAVGILGATGMVGQKFIELLQNHPDFTIKAPNTKTQSLYGWKQKNLSLFASDGYPWTIIHVENRKVYFNALETLELIKI